MNQYQWGRFKNDTSRPASKLGASYYEAYTTNGFADANPTIVPKGCVPGPVGSRVLSRTIRVQTRPRATFPVKGPMIQLIEGAPVNPDEISPRPARLTPLIASPAWNGFSTQLFARQT